jgi:hypothetical protein
LDTTSTTATIPKRLRTGFMGRSDRAKCDQASGEITPSGCWSQQRINTYLTTGNWWLNSLHLLCCTKL